MLQNVYLIVGIVVGVFAIIGFLLKFKKRKTKLSQQQEFEGSGKLEQKQEIENE